MEDIYLNVGMLEPSAASPNQPGPLRPRAKGTGRRGWGPVALGLGLLCVGLLAGLVILGVRHFVTVKDLSVTQPELTEQQKVLSTLEEEMSQLNSSLFSLKQNPTCPEGWRTFEDACYHLSDKGDSWNNSRNDCMAKGGDLVVIESSQEQKLLSEYEGQFWIGLTDLEQEGTWKWVDGAPLILSYWEKRQPDNGNKETIYGEEDCVHIIVTVHKWNDISCNTNLQWVCETSAQDAQISLAQ